MVSVKVTREDGQSMTLSGEQCVSMCMEAAATWARMEGDLPAVQYLQFELPHQKKARVRISREDVLMFLKGETRDGETAAAAPASGEDSGLDENVRKESDPGSDGVQSEGRGDSSAPVLPGEC